jgi:hypothetical protein
MIIKHVCVPFESHERNEKVREASTYIALDTRHDDSAYSEKGVWQFQSAIGDCTNTFCIKFFFFFLKDKSNGDRNNETQ